MSVLVGKSVLWFGGGRCSTGCFFFFSSRRRHTRSDRDWSSDVCSSDLTQQAKLLRVIETGEFERVGSSRTLHANVRIISATNSNLHDEVAAGRFRQDLLFRLNTIEIALPPLRDRREDIMALAKNFLRQHV